MFVLGSVPLLGFVGDSLQSSAWIQETFLLSFIAEHEPRYIELEIDILAG